MSKNVKILVVVCLLIAVVVGGIFYFKNSENFNGRIFKLKTGESVMIKNKDIQAYAKNEYGRCAKEYVEINNEDCGRKLLTSPVLKGQQVSDRCERLRRAWASGDWSERVTSIVPSDCEDYLPHNVPGVSIPTMTLLRCERVKRTWANGDWTFRTSNVGLGLPEWCKKLYYDNLRWPFSPVTELSDGDNAARCEMIAGLWNAGGWTYRFGSTHMVSKCEMLYSELFD